MSPMGGARQSEGPPRRGELMRDFVVPAASGERVQLSSYRGRKNLIVVFAGNDERPLLRALADRQYSLASENAGVLAIVAGRQADAAELQRALPFLVAADPDARIHTAMGALKDGAPAPALYVTDRFGEVFAAFRTAEGKALPDADEIVDWLGFVNRQCEECFPPEWPAVG